MADAANVSAVPFLVTVPDAKTKRVNITIPERDLESIEDYAKRHKMSRSAFLLEAAKRALTSENKHKEIKAEGKGRNGKGLIENAQSFPPGFHWESP